jgi:hypothetical protein
MALLEFDAAFFKRFQDEMLQRMTVLRSGLDTWNAIDKFVLTILANSDVRSIL